MQERKNIGSKIKKKKNKNIVKKKNFNNLAPSPKI